MENKFDLSSTFTIILNLQPTYCHIGAVYPYCRFSSEHIIAHPLKRIMNGKISDPSIKTEAASETGASTTLSGNGHNEK